MSTKPAAVPAFPLQWPKAVPRTKPAFRDRSKFGKVDWNRSLKELRSELGRLGAQYVTVSTNMQLRQDGNPYAQQRTIEDPGVAVYFQLDGEQLCFPCDRWLSIADNMRAITKHIEAMRGQQRWGVGTAKQAFAGYKALPQNAGEAEDWRTVLGLSDNATVEAIKNAHRLAAMAAHPDRGGSADQMARINTARDRALAEKGGA